MASIREVAREAGVSIATVSRVINGRDSVAPHLRRQVLEAVNRCEYAPAVGIRSQNSVALIYTGPFTPGSPYDSACIDGMVEAMRGSPHDLIFVDILATLEKDHEIEGYETFALAKMDHEAAKEVPLVLVEQPAGYDFDFMVGWPDFVFARLKRPVLPKIFRRASTWI